MLHGCLEVHQQGGITMSTLKKIAPFAVALSFVLTVGCAALDDDVTVGEAADDAAITAKVKAALIDDDELDAAEINVNTREGIVQLLGTVDDRSDINRATNVASDIEGVRSVRNELVLE
jgi:osmotically-inducible protein OsmY